MQWAPLRNSSRAALRTCTNRGSRYSSWRPWPVPQTSALHGKINAGSSSRDNTPEVSHARTAPATGSSFIGVCTQIL